MLNASVFISVFRAWLGVKARVTAVGDFCVRNLSLFWVASAKIENRRLWLHGYRVVYDQALVYDDLARIRLLMRREATLTHTTNKHTHTHTHGNPY